MQIIIEAVQVIKTSATGIANDLFQFKFPTISHRDYTQHSIFKPITSLFLINLHNFNPVQYL